MMTSRALIGIAFVGLIGFGPIQADDQALDPDQWGLSPTSVFDVPTPEAFGYPDTRPGSSELLPRGFPGAPPMVPHDVGGYLPITMDRNRCLTCHDDFELIGKAEAEDPTPMPKSHYAETDGRFTPSGHNHVCTQCHVPQADVPPLMGSTF
jgi:nitrate reductase (cytochrome), electron transfer subunit